MNKLFKISASALVMSGMLFATSVRAEVVGLGTTAGGANATIGAAIAKVVSDNAAFQMRPQKAGGTEQYTASVNAGKIEFGLSNIMQYGMSVDGTGLSEGKPSPNLRMVATLMDFYNGIVVNKNSDINSIADLKGKRVPDGYPSSGLFQVFKNGFLASAGLSTDDVTSVPVVGLRQSWTAFKDGLVDMTIIAAGAAPVREMEAAIDGGVRYIPILENDIAHANMPRTSFRVVNPAKGLIGIDEPTLFNVYEYVLFANADVDDDKVYEVVKAIYNNYEKLKATSPLWNNFDRINIGKSFEGIEYHPGALKFFEEQSIKQ